MKRLVSFVLATMLLCGGVAVYAEGTAMQEAPEYQYGKVTEKNKDLFDVKWQEQDRFAVQGRRAVLISPENREKLVVRTEVSSGIARSDKRYAESRAAVGKREENNKKTNPFYEKSKSFVRVPTIDLQGGKFGIPASASGYKNLIIYTRPNGAKWSVQKGQKVSIKYELDFSVYDSKLGDKPNKTVSIGYIKGNKMYELGVSETQNGSKQFEIPVSGEIEFYTMNGSYANQLLANGSIQLIDGL